MNHDRRSAERYEVSGAIVFYRREHEAIEKERLGILENIGPGGLLLATGEALPAGTVLLMRIYCPAGAPGHSEKRSAGWSRGSRRTRREWASGSWTRESSERAGCKGCSRRSRRRSIPCRLTLWPRAGEPGLVRSPTLRRSARASAAAEPRREPLELLDHLLWKA
jgi:hypothetical protein